MLARCMLSLCVRLSVGPSLDKITQTTLYDISWTVAFCCQRSRPNSNGGNFHRERQIKVGYCRLQPAIFNQHHARPISQKRCKIGTVQERDIVTMEC